MRKLTESEMYTLGRGDVDRRSCHFDISRIDSRLYTPFFHSLPNIVYKKAKSLAFSCRLAAACDKLNLAGRGDVLEEKFTQTDARTYKFTSELYGDVREDGTISRLSNRDDDDKASSYNSRSSKGKDTIDENVSTQSNKKDSINEHPEEEDGEKKTDRTVEGSYVSAKSRSSRSTKSRSTNSRDNMEQLIQQLINQKIGNDKEMVIKHSIFYNLLRGTIKF